MNDRELKKLSRSELLEVLIAQMKENESLRTELTEARAKLAERTMDYDEAGSIAEAALKVNGVFEAAQAAADQYLENVRALTDRAQSIADKIESESRAKADAMLTEARAECEKQKKEADAYWSSMTVRLNSFYDEYKGLREMIDAATRASGAAAEGQP